MENMRNIVDRFLGMFPDSKQKVISLSLILLLCFLLGLASTYAWGMVTSQINEWINESRGFRVELLKLERDLQGAPTKTPIEGAWFRLYHIAGEASEQSRSQVGGYLLTDENGRISVSDLAAGDYVFVEVSPGFGYGFDTDANGNAITEYLFSVPMATSEPVVVYNTQQQAPLHISKTVSNDDGTDIGLLQQQESFTFTFVLDPESSLVAVDPATEYALQVRTTGVTDGPDVATSAIKSGESFTLSHNQTAVITGIPVGAFYEVIEVVRGGYQITSTDNQGTLTSAGAQAMFAGVLPTDHHGSLTIEKASAGTESDPRDEFIFEIVFDASRVSTFAPESISFMRSGIDPDTLAPFGPSVETTGVIFTAPSTYTSRIPVKGSDRIVFDHFPLGLGFTVTEVDSKGSTARPQKVVGTIRSPQGVVVPFVNTKGGSQLDSWRIDMTKYLLDRSAGKTADQKKAFEFTVILSQGGEGSGYTDGSITYTVTRADGTTATEAVPAETGRFTLSLHAGDALSLAGSNPEPISYQILEKDYTDLYYYPAFEQVTGTIRNGMLLDLVWNNIFDPPVVPTPASLRVTKTVEGDQADPFQPFRFEVTFEGRQPEPFTLIAGETITLETTLGTNYSIRELLDPRDGVIVTGVINGTGTITSALALEGVAFTNTYIKPRTHTIEGQKSWDTRGMDVVLPQRIEVWLLDGDQTIVARQQVTSDDDWLFSFDNVLAEDANGNAIAYSIAEAPVDNYTTSISKDKRGYFTIVNTYVAPVTVNTPYVTKNVLPSDAPKLTSDFVLRGQKGAPMPAGSVANARTIQIEGSGQAQFGTISFSREGTFEYVISEVDRKVPGYTYDSAVYSLIYEVELAESEAGYHLVPSATLTRVGGNEVFESAAFVTTYDVTAATSQASGSSESGPETTQLPSANVAAGDMTNMYFWIIWLVIALGTIMFARQVSDRQ